MITTTSEPDSARRLAWPIASSAARTWSVGSWSAGAAMISASGTAFSHAVTSSGRSSASRIADLGVGGRERVGDLAQQRRAARARLGQHQHPLAEGEWGEKVHGAGEDVAAFAQRDPAGGRDRGQVLELGRASPSGSSPLTYSMRTRARWRSPRRGERAGPATSSPARSSQRRIWEAET